MVKVKFKQKVQIDTQRGHVAGIDAGAVHLLTNYHAGHCVPREARASMQPFKGYAPYDGRPLKGRSLLVLWLAGLGDTIAVAPALMSLQASNPRARIDVISIPVLYEILTATGFKGRLIEYPPPLEAVAEYDCLALLEETSRDGDCFRLDAIDFFAKLLHQPADLPPAEVRIPDSVRSKMRLVSSPLLRVGIQVKGLSPIRTYPPDLLAEVLRGLVHRGFEVHLMGGADDCRVPSAPPMLFNDCGKTATFTETAALVQQMDVMICPDSYLMHVAGVLAVPTVAIFSTLPARLRVSRYEEVVALEPRARCAPCMVVEDAACPLGYGECVALRGQATSPAVIIKSAERLVTRRYTASVERG